MNHARKPRSWLQLGSAYSWFLRFLVLTATFVIAGAARVGGALARGPSARTLFIVAGLLLCTLVIPAAIRLRRRIRQTQQGADAFMDALSQAHQRGDFAEDRAKRLEQERNALLAEKNKLLASLASIENCAD